MEILLCLITWQLAVLIFSVLSLAVIAFFTFIYKPEPADTPPYKPAFVSFEQDLDNAILKVGSHLKLFGLLLTVVPVGTAAPNTVTQGRTAKEQWDNFYAALKAAQYRDLDSGLQGSFSEFFDVSYGYYITVKSKGIVTRPADVQGLFNNAIGIYEIQEEDITV